MSKSCLLIFVGVLTWTAGGCGESAKDFGGSQTGGRVGSVGGVSGGGGGGAGGTGFGGGVGSGGGGAVGSAGHAASGSGGAIETGGRGAPATGGVPGAGGRASGSGAAGSGDAGATGTGGRPSTGGMPGAGGTGTGGFGGRGETGGVIGSGGMGATGSGGTPGGGGTSGTGGTAAMCSDIAADYQSALPAARACNTLTGITVPQCQEMASGALGCGSNCIIYVQDGAKLTEIKQRWNALDCQSMIRVCPAILCLDAKPGNCYASTGSTTASCQNAPR